MKLTEIEIIAYRSITNQTIEVHENCLSFVGLNESGKSNILKALRMLDPDFIPTIKDKSKINQALPKVRFGFEVSEQTRSEFIKYCNNFLLESKITIHPQIINKMKLTKYNVLRQLEKSGEEYKKSKYHLIDYEIEMDGQFWKPKVGAVIPPGLSTIIDGEPVAIDKVQFIKKEFIPESEFALFEIANSQNLKKALGGSVSKFFEAKLPYVVYWEYSDAYLLPSDIDYADFVKSGDPYSNCAPLFNIFMLSNRLGLNSGDDIIQRVKTWQKDSSQRRRDATIVTDEVNNYIKKIWNDFDQQLKVELEETKITIHIFDPNSDFINYYEMDSRSQGFKTFISFLLTAAAEIETEILTNCILILDEPETHLHPSGVRFMRDELTRLSECNYVFFATHSIFMIDRKNIGRHLIVKKESESTIITNVGRNNFIQESVIYEALGTTVDEFSIKPKNVIFEGRMDLLLFEYFVNHCLSQKNNPFRDYELHDGGGCKNIISFFKAKFIPKDSEWVIILDFDSPGRSLPGEIQKVCQNISNFRFKFYSSTDGYELEDILPESIIIDAIHELESGLEQGVKIPFQIQKELSISGNIAKYRNVNNLNSHRDFESKFKSKIIDIIESKLKSITKEPTIPKRHELFKELFPSYYDFVNAFCESK